MGFDLDGWKSRLEDLIFELMEAAKGAGPKAQREADQAEGRLREALHWAEGAFKSEEWVEGDDGGGGDKAA